MKTPSTYQQEAQRRHVRGRRHERGTTLIEAMVAACVVAWGVVALMGLNATGFAGLSTSSKMTYASLLANYKLSDLLGRKSTDADLTNTGPAASDYNNVHKEATNIGAWGLPYSADGQTQLTTTANPWGGKDGYYFRSWSVQDQKVGGSSTVNFKLIIVDVGWYDGLAPKCPGCIQVFHVQQAGGMSLPWTP